jgi:hypothetical protein
MDFIIWVVLACIWVALAFWPARVADRKGHSFFGYFILSLFFFPLALLMAYMVRDNSGLATS